MQNDGDIEISGTSHGANGKNVTSKMRNTSNTSNTSNTNTNNSTEDGENPRSPEMSTRSSSATDSPETGQVHTLSGPDSNEKSGERNPDFASFSQASGFQNMKSLIQVLLARVATAESNLNQTHCKVLVRSIEKIRRRLLNEAFEKLAHVPIEDDSAQPDVLLGKLKNMMDVISEDLGSIEKWRVENDVTFADNFC